MERIAGRTAFVTGGASGIGLGIAEGLLSEGARVVLADWNASSLEREAARLGDAVLVHHFDVRDRAGWQGAKKATEEAFGPVEILVNNAGVAPGQYQLADTTPEHFEKLVAIMLIGVFNGIHTFAAGMRKAGDGHIVNTASMAGLLGSAGRGAYTAAKFGIVGMSEVLRTEMKAYRVGVSVLCPGLVRTNLGRDDQQDGGPPSDRSMFEGGMDPAVVGAHVLDAIRHNDLYILTHPEYGEALASRAERLQQAIDVAAARGGRGTQPGSTVTGTSG